MSNLSYGLNLTKKPTSTTSRPAPAKRKPIFDDDSDNDSFGPENGAEQSDQLESLHTVGGLQSPSSSISTSTSSKKKRIPNSSVPPPTKNPKPSSNPAAPKKISNYGSLSTAHSTSKHSKTAQDLDPSIYDYDGVYDSLHHHHHHQNPQKLEEEETTTTANGTTIRKPKYISQLLAASQVRKRDAVRAKEKLLAKERELEGDAFADKEKFVTAAYKRQQAEMRRAEEEEERREREAEERKKREGGGMKGLYKNMLERGEERHRQVMQNVEERKGKDVGEEEKEAKTKGEEEKSEADLAREKGAVINEEGQVVDKRQLLSAGLNAGAGPKPAAPFPSARTRERTGGSRMSDRERETKAFEEQLLGKRTAGSDEEDERAAKSRKMEDEILGLLGR
ncbi:MAG: hypothetical protein Q9191_007969 [Dirinaria sp. TL-2023a]